jgi:hypothetical protein
LGALGDVTRLSGGREREKGKQISELRKEAIQWFVFRIKDVSNFPQQRYEKPVSDLEHQVG